MAIISVHTWIEDKKKNVNRAMSFLQQDDVGNLKAQMREQTRTIADLKQSLMVSDLVAVRVLILMNDETQ